MKLQATWYWRKSISSNMKKEFVIQTIEPVRRRWSLKEGTIFHSDCGSQYTSDVVMSLLKKLGIKQSFFRAGMPGDNACSESFLLT
ncbi:MAG: hypothetical protein VB076_06065 [Synergistaceae bacterium]|nr:hypothetical protein [Synergistaceae bacterium]